MSANAIGVGVPAQQKSKRSMKGRIIGALGLLVVAAIVAVGSGANFTAHSANPGNMVTEGAFSISNDREGLAVFSPVTNFDPGDTTSGDVSIGNQSGGEAGNFTVKGIAEAGNDDAFAAKTHLLVVDYQDSARTTPRSAASGGFTFSGTVKDFYSGTCVTPCNTTASYDGSAWGLGNWASGETHYYSVTVENQATGTNGSLNGNDPSVSQYFGKTTKFGIEWDAVSTA